MVIRGSLTRSLVPAVLGSALLVVGASPAAARQAGVPGPVVEVGASAAVALPDIDPSDARVAWAPRLTMNLSGRDAVSVTADVVLSKQYFGSGSWEDTWRTGVEAERLLHGDGRLRVSALAGAGLQRFRLYRAAYALPGRDGPEEVPASLTETWRPAFSFGLGLGQRLAPQLELREDVRLVLAERGSEVQFQLGLDVPIGRYPSAPVERSSAYGQLELRTGQHAWITDASGNEVEGAIGAIDDDRVEIVTGSGRVSFPRADITRLAIPDSLANGVRWGAIVGGSTAAGFTVFLVSVFCDDDCDDAAPAILAGAGYGAGVGALTGALVDSLWERQRVVASNVPARHVRIVPLLARDAQGARVHVAW